jgi:hypothetical protein
MMQFKPFGSRDKIILPPTISRSITAGGEESV